MSRLLTVHYDADAGEVTRVDVARDLQSDALMRADLLQDALARLEVLYAQALEQMHAEFDKKRGQA